jgi:hypothetical protein
MPIIVLESRELIELRTESEFLLVIQNTDLLVFYRGTIPPCGHNHMQHEHVV